MMKVALMIRAIAKPGMTALEFLLSALIFLAFRPIRPPAPEPERLPGKQDKRRDEFFSTLPGSRHKQHAEVFFLCLT